MGMTTTCRDCPAEIDCNTSLPPECRPRVCPSCRRTIKAAQKKRRKARKPKKSGPQRNDQTLAVRVKEYVNTKKTGPCVVCGGTFLPVAMDFDHRPGEIKSKDVSKLKTFASVDAEMAKCDLVCSNCHRVRTWERMKSTGSL